jgi:hypothetical protein
MTTQAPDIEAEGLAELEAFVNRMMPTYLRADSPVPASWPYSAEAWQELQQKARAVWIEQATIEFVRLVSLGWRPDELAAGPAYGTETYGDGSPKRLPAPDISPDLQHEARRLLSAAAARGIRLDGIEEGRLQQISAGHGNEQTATGVVQSVRNQIQAHDAQQRATAQEADARPILRVLHPFRARGNRHFAPGEYPISPEEAEDLRDWAEKQEAEQRRHNWPAPPGFVEGQWPPFRLEQP